MSKDYLLSEYVVEKFITPDNYSHWFGYYNNSPIDITATKMLAHRITFDGRPITSEDTAEIGYFDINTGKWNHLGVTKAFNWQQGALLQWVNINECDKVIFNDSYGDKFISRIIDIHSSDEEIINSPIYDITPDGKLSLTLEFERSYWCRAYHYETIKNPKWDTNIAEADGIFQVNLSSGMRKRIISIMEILKIDYDSTFEGSKHWLEHIMINPDGDRFAFYHRFSQQSDFHTRIFIADMDGSNLYMVPNWRNNIWSHLAWKNSDEFVVFGIKELLAGKAYQRLASPEKISGRLIKNLYANFFKKIIPKRAKHSIGASSYYQLYRDKHGLIGGYTKGRLLNDGHPSFTPDGLYMLTDTYQDKDNYRHLLLYDIQNDKLHELGKFYSPFNNCSYRSDLHPRFSPDFNMIIIDTAHTGKHQMLVLDVKWDKLKN